MEMICIRCPMGCRLSVVEQDGALQVANYSCRRGLEYGLSEFRNPQRVVTATVPTDGDPAWLPVRTAQPVPKSRVTAVLAELKRGYARAPLALGEPVLRDAAGTGVAVVASQPLIAARPQQGYNADE